MQLLRINNKIDAAGHRSGCEMFFAGVLYNGKFIAIYKERCHEGRE